MGNFGRVEKRENANSRNVIANRKNQPTTTKPTKWGHDRFDDFKQTPKTNTEIQKEYGYDLRDKLHKPDQNIENSIRKTGQSRIERERIRREKERIRREKIKNERILKNKRGSDLNQTPEKNVDKKLEDSREEDSTQVNEPETMVENNNNNKKTKSSENNVKPISDRAKPSNQTKNNNN